MSSGLTSTQMILFYIARHMYNTCAEQYKIKSFVSRPTYLVDHKDEVFLNYPSVSLDQLDR